MIQYLIPVIAFSGLFIGKLIAYLSKDELKSGEPYFYIAKKLVLFLIFIVLALNLDFNWISSLILILGLVLGFYLKLPYTYLSLALLTDLNSIILSTLIFIYGLIYATSEKSYIKEALTFFIPFSLLLTPIYPYFHSFAIGSIVSLIFL